MVVYYHPTINGHNAKDESHSNSSLPDIFSLKWIRFVQDWKDSFEIQAILSVPYNLNFRPLKRKSKVDSKSC